MATPVPAKSPLLNPSAPLSGQALYNAAVALANAQEQPTIDALKGAIGQNNTQTQNALGLTGGYFNQLGQQAGQAVGQEDRIGTGLNTRLGQIGAGEQSQLQGIGQNAADMLAKYTPGSDSALRSPAFQALATEMARQQGLAAQDQGAFKSFGANQGANYSGLAASNLGSYARAGQEALRGIATAGQVKNQPLSSRLASAISQRGALVSTDLGKLRQQEINNQITRAGLGLKQQALRNTVRQDNARNALTARGQNITLSHDQQLAMQSDRTFKLDQQKFGAAQAKDNYLRTHNLGPYKPAGASGLPKLTPTGTPTLAPQQQQVRFAQVDTLRQLIKDSQRPLTKDEATSLQKHGMNVQPGQVLTEAQTRGLLANGLNPANVRYDPALIDTAYALNGYGYVTAKQISELNKLGLIVGNRYPRPPSQKQVVKNAVGAATGATSGLGKIFG